MTLASALSDVGASRLRQERSRSGASPRICSRQRIRPYGETELFA